MKKVILHLGSNVGDRISLLTKGIGALAVKVGVIDSQSNIYETEPWGLKDQANFLNLALILQTNLTPQELLIEIKSIEVEVGRIKEEHWGPRVLDIDILFYGNEILQTNKLTIPHPEMQNRNFVLIPLMEIAGDFIHPVLNLTIEELYAESQDSCEVWILEK